MMLLKLNIFRGRVISGEPDMATARVEPSVLSDVIVSTTVACHYIGSSGIVDCIGKWQGGGTCTYGRTQFEFVGCRGTSRLVGTRTARKCRLSPKPVPMRPKSTAMPISEELQYPFCLLVPFSHFGLSLSQYQRILPHSAGICAFPAGR